MVNVLLCSLMRISFCEGQVDINGVIQNTWKSQELSLRFDPQVSWVPVQHLETLCLYKDLSWGNTIIYPKSNAPAVRIPQMFNHSDGSSQGLRLTLKQVLKKRKKSEQLSETALETYSHLQKLFSCKKAKNLKERRKTDLICIWKQTPKTHQIFGKFDMAGVTWVLWGLKRKTTRWQYFFPLYPKYRSKSTWVALQNRCQLRNSTDNYLRNKH